MTRARQQLNREIATLAVAAPQVVAMRLGRMWLAGAQPSADDRREWQRMQQEKIDAFAEGWQAMGSLAWNMQQAAFATWMRSWMTPWRMADTGQVLAQWQRDAERLLATGLAPARRRTVANARRLQRG